MGSSPRRVPVPPGSLQPGTWTLPPEAAHYVQHVLRLKPGAVVQLFDGAGQRAPATLGEDGVVTVEKVEAAAALEVPRVTLVCALSKGEKPELIIEKASELGAHAVWPVVCARSVVQLKDERAANRLERWTRVAQAAARQCGRDHVLQVHPVTPFADMVASAPDGEKRILTLATAPLSETLPDTLDAITVCSGPEGGFDAQEVATAVRAGFVPAGLGPLTLRAETAPLAALAVVMAHAGVM